MAGGGTRGTLDPDHVGIETFDDPAGQLAWSHHWIDAGGRLVRHSAPYRYVWPSELDLMARIELGIAPSPTVQGVHRRLLESAGR